MKKIGRPSSYTEAKGDEICRRLALGESLITITKTEGMPNRWTVARWLASHESFRVQYASARDVGLEVMADECIQIADEAESALTGDKGDGALVMAKRLRFDARRWYLSKLAPKRYGDAYSAGGDQTGKPEVHVTVEIDTRSLEERLGRRLDLVRRSSQVAADLGADANGNGNGNGNGSH